VTICLRDFKGSTGRAGMTNRIKPRLFECKPIAQVDMSQFQDGLSGRNSPGVDRGHY
jgi:hypothetical protein